MNHNKTFNNIDVESRVRRAVQKTINQLIALLDEEPIRDSLSAGRTGAYSRIQSLQNSISFSCSNLRLHQPQADDKAVLKDLYDRMLNLEREIKEASKFLSKLPQYSKQFNKAVNLRPVFFKLVEGKERWLMRIKMLINDIKVLFNKLLGLNNASKPQRWQASDLFKQSLARRDESIEPVAAVAAA